MHLRYRGLVMSGDFGPLIITDLQMPVSEKRNTFVNRLNDHGQYASREWLEARTWSWTMSTNSRSLESALSMGGRLEALWNDRDAMNTTSVYPLEYSNDGGETWFRVYGRPGRHSPVTPGPMLNQGMGVISVEFIQTDLRHYSGLERSNQVLAVPSSTGGLKNPLRAPLSSIASPAPRAGHLINEGNLPAPVKVTFIGPSTNPHFVDQRGRHMVGYRGTLTQSQRVVIDPLAQTVLLNGTVSVPGRLTMATRLNQLAVAAGGGDWFYKATDTTGTSKGLLNWRDAFNSMQL